MGKPAARITDMHVCPMVTVLVPHVGGPIVGPGAPTVMIGGMPAAVMGDICTCVGPPSSIILGSTGVFISKKPAARMGDMTAHGGVITTGLPTVLIGETSVVSQTPLIMEDIMKIINQIETLIEAASDGSLGAHECG